VRVVEGIADVDDVDAFVARLGEIGAAHGCAVQAFDARYVVDRAHLESAVGHANRSVARGEAVADDRAVEILLYAAGRRQIREALAIGVEEGETPAAVVVDDGTLRPDGRTDASDERGRSERDAAERVRELLRPAATLGDPSTERITDFFDVSDAERRASDASLSALVRERVALLDVEK